MAKEKIIMAEWTQDRRRQRDVQLQAVRARAIALSLGRRLTRARHCTFLHPVIPAQAGIQSFEDSGGFMDAGMTGKIEGGRAPAQCDCPGSAHTMDSPDFLRYEISC
jgi:hypothetical protein